MERKSRGSYDDKKWVNPKCCLRGAFATNFKGAVVPSSSITLRTSHNDTPPFREDVIICKRVTLLPAPRLGPFVLHSRYTSTSGAPNKALSHSAVLLGGVSSLKAASAGGFAYHQVWTMAAVTLSLRAFGLPLRDDSSTSKPCLSSDGKLPILLPSSIHRPNKTPQQPRLTNTHHRDRPDEWPPLFRNISAAYSLCVAVYTSLGLVRPDPRYIVGARAPSPPHNGPPL